MEMLNYEDTDLIIKISPSGSLQVKLPHVEMPYKQAIRAIQAFLETARHMESYLKTYNPPAKVDYDLGEPFIK